MFYQFRFIKVIVAEHDRKLLWQNDEADVKGYSCQFKGGTIGTNIPLLR